MEPNSSSYSSIFIKYIVIIYLSLHNKMGLLNVFPIVITFVFLMSMHANEAAKILHGGEQELLNNNYNVASLQGSLEKGPVTPSEPNPSTNQIHASTVNQKAIGGHNMGPFKSTLARGPVPPSRPNPPTHIPIPSKPNSGTHNIPVSTISGRAFGGNNMGLFKNSLAKGTVHPFEPNPPTYIPSPEVMDPQGVQIIR